MVGTRQLTFPPGLERLGPVLPMFLESLLEGCVERASKVGGEGLDSEAVWNPRGAGRPIVELDRHFPEAPHLPIPASAEQP